MKAAREILLCIPAVLLGLTCPVWGQERCQAPPIVPSSLGPNIFSEQQEMDLGDAIADELEQGVRVTQDAEVTAYFERIGETLLKSLPPTHLRFRYFLVDLPIPDAFSAPGGRIYVSRKMVAFARDEDEMAGVIGHEIGHIVTHQGAIAITRLLREVLGITNVSDRQDIFDKLNQLAEDWRRNPEAFREVQKRGEAEQSAADQVALYSLASAGYSPQAFVSIFDRLAQTKGNTGNWLSDFFHTTKPGELRLREMLKLVRQMPKACAQGNRSSTDSEFRKWQTEVINFSAWSPGAQTETLHGVLAKIQLDSPLTERNRIAHLKFSPDGRYILAQDSAKIYVLTRDPFAYAFQFDVFRAQPAQFAPDSKSVVFSDSNLRVESWEIASQKRVSVYEPVVPGGCQESLLAPDGKTLACSTKGDALILLDTTTGSEIFRQAISRRRPWGLHMGFSPDCRYFLAANIDQAVAFDLPGRSRVRLKGSLRDVLSGGFAFLGSDRLVGRDANRLRDAVLVSFPSGKNLATIHLGLSSFDSATHGDYLLVGPLKEYAIGVMDLKTQKIVIAEKERACDIYDELFVKQLADGDLGLYDTKTRALKARLAVGANEIPIHPATALVSPDFRWLAISSFDRGGIWDLTNGKRLYSLRKFNGGWFSSDGWFYADFPKGKKIPREIIQMRLPGPSSAQGLKLEERYVRQEGPFLVVSKPRQTGGILSQENALGKLVRAFDPCRRQFPDFDPFDCDVGQEVRDLRTGRTLWSKEFPREVPGFRVQPDQGTVLVIWRASTEAARNEIKNYLQLSNQFAAIKDKKGIYLLEVLDASNGRVLRAQLMDTGLDSWGVARIWTAGDKIIVPRKKRILVYSLATGKEEGQIAGWPLSMGSGPLLSATAARGNLAVYDLNSMKKIDEFQFSSPIVTGRFSPDGKHLFVLTATQIVYLLDIARSVP